MLHPKIFDLTVYLGDVDTHALGRAQLRRSNRIAIVAIGASVAKVPRKTATLRLALRAGRCRYHEENRACL